MTDMFENFDYQGFMTAMLIVYGVVLALVLLALIYLLINALILIRPAKKEEVDGELMCDYAHRGLHGQGVPENSLKAFDLACRAGFGIELDVQLSKDGEVMVFHDYTLLRMTGVDKKICELDAAEIKEIKFKDSELGVPTFREALEIIDGRVPVLVELKGEETDVSLCPKVAEILNEYKGKYCIESFNPLLVKKMRELLPDAFCGLLYTNVVRDKKKVSLINVLVSDMAFNFLCKPCFIAYNEYYRKAFCIRVLRRFYKAPMFVWTINNQASLDKAHSRGEAPIFENIDRNV